MTQKFLIITAFFCATQLAQAADKQPQLPPTDKTQPKSGNLQRRTPTPQPTPPISPALARHQSGDLSALIADYRESEGLPPITRSDTPPTTPNDQRINQLSRTAAALSLMLPDACQQVDHQPKKGSLRRPHSAEAAASSHTIIGRRSTSPETLALPLPNIVAHRPSLNQEAIQRPRRSSGEKPPIPHFWQEQRPDMPEKEETRLEPRKPAGKPEQRYALGSRTNLQLQGINEPTEVCAAASSTTSPERAEALEFYKRAKALMGECISIGIKLLDCQNEEDLENQKEEAEQEGNNTQFKEWMKSFYDGLLEQKRKHEERLAKELQQEKRREHIKRSRSALGLDELRCVLFKSPESTPNALVVSPTTVLGEVFNDQREIPHRDERDEKKFEDDISRIQLSHLIQEYWETSDLKEQTTIKESLKAFLTLHPYLQTEETTTILESESF